jgi:beta-lactam-binding protein with PASTA domain
VNVPSVAPGTVVGQTPSGGSRAELDQIVILNVATGATLLAIPDTLGRTEVDARAAIEAAGFTVQVLLQDGDTAPGTVWSQSPSGGSTAVAGTTVRIWVTPIATTTTEGPTTTTPESTSTTVETTTTTSVPDGPTTTTVVQG